MQSFVFLDRDGTLIEDTRYPHRPEHYRLFPGAIDALLQLRSKGYPLAIVTNQSGIGRGYFSEKDFHAFQAILLEDLRRGGIELEATLFCPHRPEDGCSCRKPKIGLLSRATQEFGADCTSSWFIGDSLADMQLAKNASCQGQVLVTTGRIVPPADQLPEGTHVAGSLREAVRLIPPLRKPMDEGL